MIKKILTLLLIVTGFFVSNAVNAEQVHSRMTVKEAIVKHSMELGIDPALGLSIAKLESGFCHEKRSSHGAVGVFQLMPNTARALGYNPWHMQDNVRGGLVYYNMLYKRFGSVELALAAYNAGPANVVKYKGVPPFGETRKFVSNIMYEYKNQKTNPDPAIVNAKRKVYNANVVKKSSNFKVTENKRPIARIPDETPRLERDQDLEQAINSLTENILL